MLAISRVAATAAVLSISLVACGGGGGGGNGGSAPTPIEPPPTTPAPVPGFTLTGTISASDSQAVDSDTNDPAREAVDNNSPATAQRIPNPITVGGYVNVPGSGATGQSSTDGDREDFYRVDLLAGQVITMLVANFENADADLYLRNARGDIVDFSLETGELESVMVEEDGAYFIEVFAFAGATNYILAVGNDPTTALPDAVAAANIVPWQAVVKFHGESARRTLTEAEMDRGMGMRMRAGGRGRERLMAVDPDGGSLRARLNRLGAAARKRADMPDNDLRARWETLMMIKHLRRDPMIESAAPNYRVTTVATPDDAALDLQWHYPLIGLPEAWDTTTGSADVIVAVIDTGVVADHPDLAGQLVPGFDFVRDPVNAADGGGIDSNPTDPGSAFGGVGSYHGTHVSGTVAARGDNGIGVAGTAYDARVMPLRALGIDGGGTTYDVNQAVRFAAGLANDSGTVPERPATIINLSLGGGLPSQAEQDLFRSVRQRGVIVVAAAGNSATTAPFYPAAYDGVISVSAVDTQRRIAPYSNTGRTIDVAAPGGNSSVDLTGDGYPDGVLSTGASGTGNDVDFVYAFLNGTSMAAPHVAGVIALMKSINPGLGPDDVDALLTAGSLTEDLGVPGRDDVYGHGLIDARRAVDAALESIGLSPADNPRLLASSSTLNFGASTDILRLSLRNGGGGDLEVLSVDSAEPWLNVAPAAVDTNGLGDYDVRVDRSSLPPGIYAADIRADSNVNTLSVRVFVSVFSENAASDVGVVYVLLYDVATDQPVAEFVSGGRDGAYGFRFEDIPAGSYQVLAGTDSDNDLFICDAGEACGAWLSTDQPITINLDGDTGGLDFPVEYRVLLPTTSAEGAAPAPGTPRPTDPEG